MIKYHRISFFEREEISRHLASRHSLRVIATSLRRAPSSISREIRQSRVIDLKKVIDVVRNSSKITSCKYNLSQNR